MVNMLAIMENKKKMINKENIELIVKHILEDRKSMGWYKRNIRDIRNKYLGYKFRFQDWVRK